MGVWTDAKEVVARREQGLPDKLAGWEILNAARDGYVARYAHFKHRRDASKVTLWAQHTHFKQKGTLVFGATPRLLVLSRKPQSGKSTVLEQLNLMCTNTNGLDIEATQHGLQYSLDREHATILLDEGDVQGIHHGVLSVLNAGYTPNGKVLNGSRSKPTRVPCFGPVAIAALDTLETDQYSTSLEAFFTRCIKIYMEPGPHERWGHEAIRYGGVVNEAMAWWADRVMTEVACARPEYPAGLDYRQAQIWDPIFRIADAAGGEWPELARELAVDDDLFPESFLELMKLRQSLTG